jgi:hypothetical protein
MYVQEKNLSTTENVSVSCGSIVRTFLCICVRNAGERCCSRLIADPTVLPKSRLR